MLLHIFAYIMLNTFGVLVIFIWIGQYSVLAVPCDQHFLCTSDVCKSTNLEGCGPKKCPELEDTECTHGRILSLYEVEDDYCDCCPPTCLKYLKEGEICSKIVPEKFPKEMCGPMLECQKGDNNNFVCLRMSPKISHCLEKLTNYEEKFVNEEVGIFESPPVCTEDGEYAPVQCYGTGLCHCVDKNKGVPIFGLAGSKIEAIDSKMECLCARYHQELIEMDCRLSTHYKGDSIKEYERSYDECVELGQSNFFKFGGFKCKSNGNFDVLHCIHSEDTKREDLCFCQESDTFKSEEEFLPRSKVDLLPCYQEDYLGPCGKIIQSLKDEENDTKKTWYGGEHRPSCSPDGFFDPIQVNASSINSKFCSDREGNKIQDFETTSSKAKDSMHCRCAMATKYLDSKLGIPNCCKNGNYECYQCQKGYCYCVDQYGKQIGLEVEQINLTNLKCQNCCTKKE